MNIMDKMLHIEVDGAGIAEQQWLKERKHKAYFAGL